MAGKRYSDMDIIMMEVQKHENDEFVLGFNYPGETIEEVLLRAKETIEEYLESHKDDIKEKAPYGVTVSLDLFRRVKPNETLFKLK